ncbi:S53 family peptidase [Solimonas marina]|uniref:Peptidase S8 n=1 Tax=Solimonas marina TaxID=2714601 RepID=A0A970B9K9_9GAMM|nr:S53 family peptidase [Solimonas marina]NKF22491.1 peptidase S8 [Solimonas marina]
MKPIGLGRLLVGLLLSASAAVSASSEAATPSRVPLLSILHAAVCARPTVALTARCNSQILVDKQGLPLVTRTPSGYSPAELRDAYKITSSGSSSTVIAIVDAYDYAKAERDLGVYRAQFGLPECTTANGCFKKVDQNGGSNYPRRNQGWSQEAALDLDMASAMCPNCKIVLVEADSASFQDLATAVNTAAAIPGVHVISNSYGGDEAGSASFEPYYDHPGIAVTVSSGDDGYGVEFPASSPHVIAVGGTSLSPASNARGWTETAWSGAGSGCSAVYAKPSWQTDSGCAMRTVADVSAVADPNTGVAVYGPRLGLISGWLVFGGTSVAAPLVGGIYAVNGGTATYASEPYAQPGGLFDVLSGSNGSCGGSYLCTAGSGYDGPTGLGTPDGSGAF